MLIEKKNSHKIMRKLVWKVFHSTQRELDIKIANIC